MDDTALFPSTPAAPRPLRIEFTGSGSEYFRIWIVNLLLILVTVGLYLPFAKARRLRYFSGNTVVDGHALAFHGDAWRMFRGFVLMLALGGVYAVAGHVSPTAALIAFVILAAIWPALWRSSMRFRLGNTSWRGLRFAFRGELAGAYKALLPIYLPALMIVALPLLFGIEPRAAEEAAQPDAAAAKSFLFAMMGVFVLMLGCYPWAFALIKRYQHEGYALADQQGRFDVPTKRFYGLSLKALGLYLLSMVVLLVAMGIVVAAAFGAALTGAGGAAQAGMIGGIVGVLAYLASLAVVGPYFVARSQNLVWNGTSSLALRFGSRLGVRRLAWLTLKNWLLTALTLGLYRPFAVVATMRLRLDAMSLALDGDVERWVASREAQEQSAAGDAAGDFFGIDMGL